jgi:hypothetical protein
VASTWVLMSPPVFLPYSTALSMRAAYSGFLEAARMREGLVVASWGLYLAMVAKSPESQTTVYLVSDCRDGGGGGVGTYGAGGFQLIERV